jgi:outer membrane immunogenic protein
MSNRTGVLGLGAAAILASVSLASAADLGGPTPPSYAPYTPEFSWAGLYFGVHGGAGWGSAIASTPADFGIAGPYIGAQAGYNFVMLGDLVLGAEADINWSGINGIRQSGAGGGITTTEDIDWFGTVRGRVGWAMGTWMPYITGGWAYASATRTTSVGLQTLTRGHSGWTAGAGVEWALTPNWTVKAEYKYLAFGPATYVWAVGPASTVNLGVHSAEIGVNYKF